MGDGTLLGQGWERDFHQTDVALPKTESCDAICVRMKLLLHRRRLEGIDQVVPHYLRRTRTEYRQVIPANKVGDVVSYEGRDADVVVLSESFVMMTSPRARPHRAISRSVAVASMKSNSWVMNVLLYTSM